MRTWLAVLGLVGCAALARAQDAEQQAAQKAWHEEDARGLRLYQSGRYAEALACWERALPLAERGCGPQARETAAAHYNLARLHQAQGQYDRAESLHRRALDIREQALGGGHPETARSLNGLAELYRSRGQYARAESLHR